MTEPTEPELQDKELTCRDCGDQFVHDVREQIFFKEMNFTNAPSRCVPCRRAKKDRMNDANVIKV